MTKRRFKYLVATTLAALRVRDDPHSPYRSRHSNRESLSYSRKLGQFPPGFTKWSPVSGVDVDAHDNVYVFQRSEAMPIMVFFDRSGRFLRTFGQGVFKQPHFLQVENPSGDIWVTDRQTIQAYEFSADGKLLMTLGKKASPATTPRRTPSTASQTLRSGEERRRLHRRRRRR